MLSTLPAVESYINMDKNVTNDYIENDYIGKKSVRPPTRDERLGISGANKYMKKYLIDQVSGWIFQDAGKWIPENSILKYLGISGANILRLPGQIFFKFTVYLCLRHLGRAWFSFTRLVLVVI